MKKQILVAVLSVLAAVSFTACKKNTDPSAAGSPVLQAETVNDLLEKSEIAVVAHVSGDGQVVGYGNGMVTIGNSTFDDTTYYLQYNYVVDEVINGDASIVGQTILVEEYLGEGADASAISDEELISMTPDTDQLLFLNHNAEDDIYYYPLPQLFKADVTDDGEVIFADGIQGGEYTQVNLVKSLAEEEASD